MASIFAPFAKALAEVESSSAAWNSGYDGYWNGTGEDENPYDANDERHGEWTKGWQAALSEDKRAEWDQGW